MEYDFRFNRKEAEVMLEVAKAGSLDHIWPG